MLLSCGGGQGRDHIPLEGDVFSYVPEANYTDFQQKITMKTFTNDTFNF